MRTKTLPSAPRVSILGGQTVIEPTRPWLYDPATIPRSQSVVRPMPYAFELIPTLEKYLKCIDHVPELALTRKQYDELYRWTRGSYHRHAPRPIGRFHLFVREIDDWLCICLPLRAHKSEVDGKINPIIVYEED